MTSYRVRPTVPNAPYVLTRRNGSNERFIAWLGLRRFRTGNQLNTSTAAVNARTAAVNQAGGAANAAPSSPSTARTPGGTTASEMAANVTRIVSQFSQA